MNNRSRRLNSKRIGKLKILIICNLLCTIMEIAYFIYNLYSGIYIFKPEVVGIILGVHLGINIASLCEIYKLIKVSQKY